jgi:uncharacterized membrane protein affecting hemolysin expression
MKGVTAALLLAFVLLVVLALLSGKEQFTSPGTIVQLATSHVPTEEELDSAECVGGLYGCVYRWIPFGYMA